MEQLDLYQKHHEEAQRAVDQQTVAVMVARAEAAQAFDAVEAAERNVVVAKDALARAHLVFVTTSASLAAAQRYLDLQTRLREAVELPAAVTLLMSVTADAETPTVVDPEPANPEATDLAEPELEAEVLDAADSTATKPKRKHLKFQLLPDDNGQFNCPHLEGIAQATVNKVIEAVLTYGTSPFTRYQLRDDHGIARTTSWDALNLLRDPLDVVSVSKRSVRGNQYLVKNPAGLRATHSGFLMYSQLLLAHMARDTFPLRGPHEYDEHEALLQFYPSAKPEFAMFTWVSEIGAVSQQLGFTVTRRPGDAAFIVTRADWSPGYNLDSFLASEKAARVA